MVVIVVFTPSVMPFQRKGQERTGQKGHVSPSMPKNTVPYKGHDLYVFRFRPLADGTWLPCNSKPCAACTKKIKKAKIRNVYYSVTVNNPDGTYGFKIVKERAEDMYTTHVSFGNRFQKK